VIAVMDQQQQFFVHPDQLEAFQDFESRLRRQLQPSGELEHHVFLQLLHAAWNIRRCHSLEIAVQNEAIAKGVADALLDDELAKKFERIDRHRRQHESAQRAALKELRQLQAEALFRSTIAQFEDEPVLAPAAKVLAEVHRTIDQQQRRKIEPLGRTPQPNHPQRSSLPKHQH
jgi:hypothetical protein